MKRSTASRGAFAILVALPLLPVCGIVLNSPPVVVFSIGGTAFVSGVLLLVWLLAAFSLLAGVLVAQGPERPTFRGSLLAHRPFTST